jgi:hypothetical protein
MRCLLTAYVKIIAEQINYHWFAWFEDAPEVKVFGEWPGAAVLCLLDHVAGCQCDAHKITDLPEAAREGHLEFVIPIRTRSGIPQPSVN